MTDDRLPVETEPQISEDVRQRGIDFLQGLLASGKVELDRFQSALDGLLDARTHADFASVIRSLPPAVEFTPAARRRQEPLKISTSMGEVRLKGRWQAGRLTKKNSRICASDWPAPRRRDPRGRSLSRADGGEHPRR